MGLLVAVCSRRPVPARVKPTASSTYAVDSTAAASAGSGAAISDGGAMANETARA
ncbi:hypothetical protein [Salinispora arenicola]|uniref:Uncharacterized protein n=1 Tax=Salinispora arenicola (strain CNS-205) TaxID=391037 RepID=A8LXH6_SALAI|nr:hypothetical protein [Salinispora arenicola]MCN0177703.1 hypothetical protein [Salinispora arenicola]NIL59942.1 hypothetical protein [Salinispora arenicola]